MATKILMIEAPGFQQNFVSFPEASVAPAAACKDSWLTLSATDSLLTLAPASARFDPALGEAFDKTAGSLSCAYFQRAEDMQSSDLGFLNEESRALGAKAHLAKGSTIYSETFFNAVGVGARLDPVYRFARSKFAAGLSLDAWASFQALLFLALRGLPNQGEAGTGERVDVQVGADNKNFVYTIRFDLASAAFAQLRRQPILELARGCAGIVELRYVRDAAKAEITAHFPLGAKPLACIEVHSVHSTSPVEAVDSAKDYAFQTFAGMPGQDAPEQRVLKAGGFRKKFSDKVAAEAPASAPAPEAAPAPAPAPKVMVSGSVSLGKKEAPATAPASAAPGPSPELEKKIALLTEQAANLQAEIARKDGVIKELHAAKAAAASSAAAAPPAVNTESENHKMVGLELELKEKLAVIDKLSKELEDIKDPSKRNVISGIKDNTVEAWKQKFERAQKELDDAGAREKEMLAVLDKAVVMKDEASKKLKALETKLSAASGGKSSQVSQLEKQLEEQKRQNKELSKRVSSLLEQMDAAGIKRVA